MNAVPGKGRDDRESAAQTADPGESVGEPDSVSGLSSPPAKCLSLPVGDDLRLDLELRRRPARARLHSRYGESAASAASENVEGRRAPVPAASVATAERANEKAATALECTLRGVSRRD